MFCTSMSGTRITGRKIKMCERGSSTHKWDSAGQNLFDPDWDVCFSDWYGLLVDRGKRRPCCLLPCEPRRCRAEYACNMSHNCCMFHRRGNYWRNLPAVISCHRSLQNLAVSPFSAEGAIVSWFIRRTWSIARANVIAKGDRRSPKGLIHPLVDRI